VGAVENLRTATRDDGQLWKALLATGRAGPMRGPPFFRGRLTRRHHASPMQPPFFRGRLVRPHGSPAAPDLPRKTHPLPRARGRLSNRASVRSYLPVRGGWPAGHRRRANVWHLERSRDRHGCLRRARHLKLLPAVHERLRLTLRRLRRPYDRPREAGLTLHRTCFRHRQCAGSAAAGWLSRRAASQAGAGHRGALRVGSCGRAAARRCLAGPGRYRLCSRLVA
jgi:hypothetical protein